MTAKDLHLLLRIKPPLTPLNAHDSSRIFSIKEVESWVDHTLRSSFVFQAVVKIQAIELRTADELVTAEKQQHIDMGAPNPVEVHPKSSEMCFEVITSFPEQAEGKSVKDLNVESREAKKRNDLRQLILRKSTQLQDLPYHNTRATLRPTIFVKYFSRLYFRVFPCPFSTTSSTCPPDVRLRPGLSALKHILKHHAHEGIPDAHFICASTTKYLPSATQKRSRSPDLLGTSSASKSMDLSTNVLCEPRKLREEPRCHEYGTNGIHSAKQVGCSSETGNDSRHVELKSELEQGPHPTAASETMSTRESERLPPDLHKDTNSHTHKQHPVVTYDSVVLVENWGPKTRSHPSTRDHRSILLSLLRPIMRTAAWSACSDPFEYVHWIRRNPQNAQQSAVAFVRSSDAATVVHAFMRKGAMIGKYLYRIRSAFAPHHLLPPEKDSKLDSRSSRNETRLARTAPLPVQSTPTTVTQPGQRNNSGSIGQEEPARTSQLNTAIPGPVSRTPGSEIKYPNVTLVCPPGTTEMKLFLRCAPHEPYVILSGEEMCSKKLALIKTQHGANISSKETIFEVLMATNELLYALCKHLERVTCTMEGTQLKMLEVTTI